MRRYAILFAAVILCGAALVVLGRPRAGARVEAAPTVEAPVQDVALVVRDGRLVPERVSVPVGSLVRLVIENRGKDVVRVTLPGYEDRLAIGAVAPGDRWMGEFLADRPGDDFAWTLDGAPAGRLDVTGSHLVEGHR